MLIERIFQKIDKPARAAILATFISGGSGISQVSAVGEGPKGRIVYAAKEKDGPNATYTSNVDGSDKKVLVNNLGHDRRYMAILPNGRVVYSEWKDGKANIVVLDTQTGKKQELTTSQDKPANTIDICPFPDSTDSVLFTRSGFRQQGIVNEILRAFLDGRKTEVLKPGSKEDFCPIVSPNRKYVAVTLVSPAAGFSEPQGVAIYDGNSYGGDKINLISKLAGIRFLGWMPTSQEVILTKKSPNGESLYVVSIDGKQSRMITDMDVGGASASADGKWILVSASGEGRGPADLWLFSSQGGQGTRITNTPYSETSPQWLTESKPEPKPEVTPTKQVQTPTHKPILTLTPTPEVKLTPTPDLPPLLTNLEGTNVIIVSGLGGSVRNGIYETAQDFVGDLVTKQGFRGLGVDIFQASYGGWSFHPRTSLYEPRDQDCTNTLKSRKVLGSMVAQLLVDVQANRPKQETVVFSHSWGGPVTLEAVKIIREKNLGVDLSKVRFVVTSGPNTGTDKPGLDNLGALLFSGLQGDCKIVGVLPHPAIVNYPAGVELLQMWDNRIQEREKLSGLSAWLLEKGSEIYSLFNYSDCVITARTCHLPELIQRIWLALGMLKEPLTQEIPGATRNIGRFYLPAHLLDLAHWSFWKADQGLGITVEFAGKQKKG